jgi:hypothetical protein
MTISDQDGSFCMYNPENIIDDAQRSAHLSNAGDLSLKEVPSFGVYRRTNSPMLTLKNIESVPIETNCAKISISTTKASKPVVTPVKMDAFAGVPNRGDTCANHSGSKPSLDIVI